MVLNTVFPLVLASVGIGNADGISTRLFTILYIITALVFARLCSRDSKLKSEIIAFTEPGSLSYKLLLTNITALRWMESSCIVWFLVKGSHTALAYSIGGLTRVVYATAFTICLF